MRQHKQLLTQVTGGMDIEAGSVPGVPVVEIAGRSRVLIENHHGIIEYGCCEIRAKVKFGCICVRGSKLELAKMSKQQLVICGCIDEIRLVERG